jgi:hypothetical protein
VGLDMFLYGTKYDMARERPKEDGFQLVEQKLELCYWRKHPDLHGYIVQTFAGGKDECQDIPLSANDLRKILEASESDQLPHTEGFFFGDSRPEDKADTKEQLSKAIAWLEDERAALKEGKIRSAYYRASW